ncbi:hypothetical protein FOCC_FOCC002031 [Frankliniella occidentalis]|nr:hypothetical protein FOCC_FOCC002031 [Frankliniella occidentalis]
MFQKATEENSESMHTEENQVEVNQPEENPSEENPSEQNSPEENNDAPASKGPKKKRNKKKKKKPAINTSEPSTTNSIPGKFVLANQARSEGHNPRNKRGGNDSDQGPPKKIRRLEELSSKLVLMQGGAEKAYSILTRSASTSRMTLQQDINKSSSGMEVTLSINGLLLSKATGPTLAETKDQCAQEGLAKLQNLCYTLIVKDRLAGSVVDKTDVSDAKQDQDPKDVPDHLSEDSKVNRMMKLMGWGGGGLGKKEQGREEPVQYVSTLCLLKVIFGVPKFDKPIVFRVVQHVKRAGLGKQLGSNEFRKNITDTLQKFKRSNATHDLVFASDFSKEERSLIHSVAAKFGLKSVSYGKDDNRQLVVSVKKRPLDIVSEVQRAGGSTDKYDLIPPRNVSIS